MSAPASSEAELQAAAPDLYQAVRHTLDRAQVNADLGYQIGPGMETFRLLCIAEARATGQVLDALIKDRSRDLSGGVRPAAVVLREARTLLQRLVDLVDSGEFRDGLPLRALARDAAEALGKDGGA